MRIVRALAAALLLAVPATLPGCAGGGEPVDARGSIIASDGARLVICRPAEGTCAPLIADGAGLPKHDLQVWPSLRRPDNTVVFEAQAINGPNALVEVDLDGGLVGVHPEAHLPAVSPDGTRVAYRAAGDLVLRSLDPASGEPVRVVAPGMADRHPAVWVGRNRLVFRGTDGANHHVDLATGDVTEWGGGTGAPAAASGDGRHVLLVENRRIVERELDGSAESVITERRASSFGSTVIPSPEGRWLAYVAGRAFSLKEARDLHLLDRETGKDAVLRENMTLFGGLWVE